MHPSLMLVSLGMQSGDALWLDTFIEYQFDTTDKNTVIPIILNVKLFVDRRKTSKFSIHSIFVCFDQNINLSNVGL